MEGLLLALERFDPSRRTPFPAFAHATITGLVNRYRRANARIVGVPTRVDARLGTLVQAAERLTQELGREPTGGELADRAGLNPDEVGRLTLAERAAQTEPFDDDVLEPGIESGFDGVETHIDLGRALASLSASDRAMVEAYFWAGLSQSAIAERLGASQMTVSRRLAGIVARLRRSCN
jgi:RNA polymerase sigma-B factor